MRNEKTKPSFRALPLVLLALAAGCGPEQPEAAGAAGGGVQGARAALGQEVAPAAAPALSSEERLARNQAATEIASQTAEQRARHRQAEVLAQRTALATQREVLEQMRQARTRAAAAERAGLDDSIAEQNDRIAERSAKLRQLEAAGP